MRASGSPTSGRVSPRVAILAVLPGAIATPIQVAAADSFCMCQAVAAPGLIAAHSAFTANISLAATGGRTSPIKDGYHPLLHIWTELAPGKVHMSGSLAPGRTVEVMVEVKAPTALETRD